VVALNGSVPTGDACDQPIVELPAPLKCSTAPVGRVLAERYSLTAQPDEDPVPSSTINKGDVPPLQWVTAPDAEQLLSAEPEPLAHWSYPVLSKLQ